MLSAKQAGSGELKVSIKELSVDMEIKNSGLEVDVYSPDGETHHGDLVVTKSGLTWCKGKTTRAKGVKATWAEFIKWMETK